MKTTTLLLRPRALSCLAAAAMVFTLVACGGTEDESDQGTSSQSSQSSSNESDGDETGSGSEASEGGANLPEGFPDGVPLPEYNEIKSGGQLSETTWRLLLVVDPDDDDVAENYAAVLTDAGFEVDLSGSMVSGYSPTLSIDAVVRPPTMTLQVIERSE